MGGQRISRPGVLPPRFSHPGVEPLVLRTATLRRRVAEIQRGECNGLVDEFLADFDRHRQGPGFLRALDGGLARHPIYRPEWTAVIGAVAARRARGLQTVDGFEVIGQIPDPPPGAEEDLLALLAQRKEPPITWQEAVLRREPIPTTADILVKARQGVAVRKSSYSRHHAGGDDGVFADGCRFFDAMFDLLGAHGTPSLWMRCIGLVAFGDAPLWQEGGRALQTISWREGAALETFLTRMEETHAASLANNRIAVAKQWGKTIRGTIKDRSEPPTAPVVMVEHKTRPPTALPWAAAENANGSAVGATWAALMQRISEGDRLLRRLAAYYERTRAVSANSCHEMEAALVATATERMFLQYLITAGKFSEVRTFCFALWCAGNQRRLRESAVAILAQFVYPESQDAKPEREEVLLQQERLLSARSEQGDLLLHVVLVSIGRFTVRIPPEGRVRLELTPATSGEKNYTGHRAHLDAVGQWFVRATGYPVEVSQSLNTRPCTCLVEVEEEGRQPADPE